MYQHGDVKITPTNEVKNVVPKATGEVVLLKTNILKEGEVTGHSHSVIGQHLLFMFMRKMYLRALEDCKVVHDEHDVIELPPGDYEVDSVKQVNWFNSSGNKRTWNNPVIRNVVD